MLSPLERSLANDIKKNPHDYVTLNRSAHDQCLLLVVTSEREFKIQFGNESRISRQRNINK